MKNPQLPCLHSKQPCSKKLGLLTFFHLRQWRSFETRFLTTVDRHQLSMDTWDRDRWNTFMWLMYRLNILVIWSVCIYIYYSSIQWILVIDVYFCRWNRLSNTYYLKLLLKTCLALEAVTQVFHSLQSQFQPAHPRLSCTKWPNAKGRSRETRLIPWICFSGKILTGNQGFSRKYCVFL